LHPNKVIAVMIIITLLIITASIIINRSFDNSSKQLESHINKIQASTISGNWDTASKELKLIQSHWNKIQKFWTVLLDHIEIDNINSTLARMSLQIQVKDKSSVLGESAALRLYINHIPEKESFKIKNIF
jgi:hypothetical protein